MNFLRATLTAIFIWILGILVYSISFFVPLSSDPEFQANLILTLSMIPIVFLGTHFYFKKAAKSNSFFLGLYMFSMAFILDALITVPLLIIPSGGSYSSFFSDPGFWLIAVLYVLTVVLYKPIFSKQKVN